MKLDDLKHAGLKKWVDEAVALMTPDSVMVCDGSKPEYESLIKVMVDAGLGVQLNPQKRPGSYWFRSDPSDVARAESRTFIASKEKDNAGY